MYALNRLVGPEIGELLEQRRFDRLRAALLELEPPDVADLVEGLEQDQAALVFRLLPRDLATDVFSHLEPDRQQSLIASLGTERVAALINELDPDDRTALLEELPAEVAQRLIALLTPAERSVTQAILGYPEESVGRLMTPDYVRVRAEWSIARALEHIRKYGRDAETVNVIYVIDEGGRLIDDLKIRQFLFASPEQTVESLMDRKFVTLSATDDREEAVRQMQHYDLIALPVIDSRGILVGIVTADDVADVAEEEATEDIQKMGGMEALDAPYLEIRMRAMMRKRGGWLSVLFVSEMLTATALAYFEREIEKAVVLALFIPLIISSGGNSGSQACSLIIRAMALGEVGLRQWWRVLRRELASGLMLGALLGSIALMRIMLWPTRKTLYGEHYVLVAMTVATSVIGVVTFGTIAGSMLPFILRRLGFDPAAASAPFVATLVDVTGLIIYFTVAATILHGTLL
ncbi:MAG TPA: magnesium transporter [Candidatus Dormibacteraeota bacterium]|nr:magnesium transporter [Candidatus Dormibacteraeota bacterium]